VNALVKGFKTLHAYEINPIMFFVDECFRNLCSCLCMKLRCGLYLPFLVSFSNSKRKERNKGLDSFHFNFF